MSPLRVLLILSALLICLQLTRLLRREHLRDKYAIAWLAMLPMVAVLAAFPGLNDAAAHAMGIVSPPNLLFFLASLFLFYVSVRLSVELTALEDGTRALAEEVAILRAEVERLRLADGA